MKNILCMLSLIIIIFLKKEILEFNISILYAHHCFMLKGDLEVIASTFCAYHWSCRIQLSKYHRILKTKLLHASTLIYFVFKKIQIIDLQFIIAS